MQKNKNLLRNEDSFASLPEWLLWLDSGLASVKAHPQPAAWHTTPPSVLFDSPWAVSFIMDCWQNEEPWLEFTMITVICVFVFVPLNTGWNSISCNKNQEQMNNIRGLAKTKKQWKLQKYAKELKFITKWRFVCITSWTIALTRSHHKFLVWLYSWHGDNSAVFKIIFFLKQRSLFNFNHEQIIWDFFGNPPWMWKSILFWEHLIIILIITHLTVCPKMIQAN